MIVIEIDASIKTFSACNSKFGSKSADGYAYVN